jgi:hypothetical protein
MFPCRLISVWGHQEQKLVISYYAFWGGKLSHVHVSSWTLASQQCLQKGQSNMNLKGTKKKEQKLWYVPTPHVENKRRLIHQATDCTSCVPGIRNAHDTRMRGAKWYMPNHKSTVYLGYVRRTRHNIIKKHSPGEYAIYSSLMSCPFYSEQISHKTTTIPIIDSQWLVVIHYN